MSLLDDALKQERVLKSETVTPEQIELAIAWAEGKVTTPAVGRALGTATSSANTLLARFLQAAIREGYLKRTRKGSEEANVTTPA